MMTSKATKQDGKQARKQVKKMPTGNRAADGTFRTGVSGNPKGRPRGSKSKSITVTSKTKPVVDNGKQSKQRDPATGRLQKGSKLGRGRPPGSKNRTTLLMEQLREAGPDLLKRLIQIAEQGDVPALRAVLAPLIARASDNPVKWRFGTLESLDDLRAESERILRGIEDGTLTPEQGIQVRKHLDAHAGTIREATRTNTRERFEHDQRMLAKARANRECFAAASKFLSLFYAMEPEPEAHQHPVVTLAKQIAGKPN